VELRRWCPPTSRLRRYRPQLEGLAGLLTLGGARWWDDESWCDCLGADGFLLAHEFPLGCRSVLLMPFGTVCASGAG